MIGFKISHTDNRGIYMKTIILILIFLPAANTAWGQTRCQQVGGFTYCDNGYTVQDLVSPSNQHQYIIRERETIAPDPMQSAPINPYSEQYYPRLDRQGSQFPRYSDPYRY